MGKTKGDVHNDLKETLQAFFSVDEQLIKIETVVELLSNYMSTDELDSFTDFVKSEV